MLARIAEVFDLFVRAQLRFLQYRHDLGDLSKQAIVYLPTILCLLWRTVGPWQQEEYFESLSFRRDFGSLEKIRACWRQQRFL